MSRLEHCWMKSFQNQFLCIIPNNWCYCIHSICPTRHGEIMKRRIKSMKFNRFHVIEKMHYRFTWLFLLFFKLCTAMFSGFINIYF